MLVPPLMLFLAKHPLVDKYDLSSVREVISGGATLGNELAEAVMERLSIKCIRQGMIYSTELTSFCICMHILLSRPIPQ